MDDVIEVNEISKEISKAISHSIEDLDEVNTKKCKINFHNKIINTRFLFLFFIFGTR